MQERMELGVSLVLQGCKDLLGSCGHKGLIIPTNATMRTKPLTDGPLEDSLKVVRPGESSPEFGSAPLLKPTSVRRGPEHSKGQISVQVLLPHCPFSWSWSIRYISSRISTFSNVSAVTPAPSTVTHNLKDKGFGTTLLQVAEAALLHALRILSARRWKKEFCGILKFHGIILNTLIDVEF